MYHGAGKYLYAYSEETVNVAPNFLLLSNTFPPQIFNQTMYISHES